MEVSPERVTIMEELGRGAFGRVHKGVMKEIPKPNVVCKNSQPTLHKNEGRIIAVKVLLGELFIISHERLHKRPNAVADSGRDPRARPPYF